MRAEEIFNTLIGISKIKPLKGKIVLEIGCASGTLFPLFEEQGAFIEGIDYDLNAVNKGRKAGISTHFGNIDDPMYQQAK